MSTDPTIQMLQRALNRAAQRAALTATNLANADTPGYRARELVFRERLRGSIELAESNSSHVVGGSRAAVAVRDAPIRSVRPDGNTVDVDVEMTKLAAQQGRYTAVTQMIRKHFALLRYAATDGRQ